MLISGAMLCCMLSAQTSADHPFLFVTQADAAHARAVVTSDPAYAELAQSWFDAADEADVDALPALDRAWWDDARELPWSDTYPLINHHTMNLPGQWARAARACARAHLLQPNDAWADKGKAILLGLAPYTFEYEHFDVGLNYTIFGYQALDAYDILYDRFSPDEHEQMRAFLMRLYDAVRKNDDYWVEHEPGGPLNNHYLWHKLCFVLVGLFYDRPEWVEDAFVGPKGIDECMRHGFTDDGLWLEASINYQFTATDPLVIAAEALENAGHTRRPWSDITDDGRSLQQSYDAIIKTLFPDGTIPNIGDCYARRSDPGARSAYEALWRRTGEPRYAWLLRNTSRRSPDALFHASRPLPDEVTPPLLASRLWPEHGYAMLRSNPGADYWSGDGWTLFGSYSNAPVHQNQDKLSIMLFGDGRHLLVDAEARASVFHAFSAAIQRELNRSVVCHNTVMVDHTEQRFPDRRLDLVEFHALPDVQRVTLADLDGRLYDGVAQQRTIILTADYVLDVFQLRADAPCAFTWMTHVDGAPGDANVTDWAPYAFPDGPPWTWLRNPESAPIGATYAETFDAAGAPFRIDLIADGPAEAIRCGFPRDDTDDPELYAMRCIERHADAAWFAAVYRTGDAASGEVGITLEEDVLHSLRVTVETAGRSRAHTIPQLRASAPRSAQE